MLEQALELLKMQYNHCVEAVRDDEFYVYYAEEKFKHSLQVNGAGNYLIRHINWFQNKSEKYLEMVKTSMLLHDICRFSEIVRKYKNDENYDHGVAAYIFLEHAPLFNDIRIRLPIKHHGHLIDELYDDAEYKNLPSELQEEVKMICFAIRDADKIANFYMITHEQYFLPLFIGTKTDLNAEDLKISEHVWQNAFQETTIPFPMTTVGDRFTLFFSWYVDINYKAAIEYCNKTGTTDLMFKLFDKYCSDEEFKEKYATFMRNFLNNHNFIA